MKYITVLYKDGNKFEFMDSEGFLSGCPEHNIKFKTIESAQEYISKQTESKQFFKILIIEEIGND